MHQGLRSSELIRRLYFTHTSRSMTTSLLMKAFSVQLETSSPWYSSVLDQKTSLQTNHRSLLNCSWFSEPVNQCISTCTAVKDKKDRGVWLLHNLWWLLTVWIYVQSDRVQHEVSIKDLPLSNDSLCRKKSSQVEIVFFCLFLSISLCNTKINLDTTSVHLRCFLNDSSGSNCILFISN